MFLSICGIGAAHSQAARLQLDWHLLRGNQQQSVVPAQIGKPLTDTNDLVGVERCSCSFFCQARIDPEALLAGESPIV